MSCATGFFTSLTVTSIAAMLVGVETPFEMLVCLPEGRLSFAAD
jgi:hypothetical protein